MAESLCRDSGRDRLSLTCALFWFVLVCLVSPDTSQAQETREAIIAEQQASRLDETAEPPGALERVFHVVEDSGLPERIMEGLGGIYPRFGGLSPAGGFGFGAGYRRHLGPDTVAQAGFTGSFRGYQLVDVALSHSLFGRSLGLLATAAYRDYPQERYFGIGAQSDENRRTHYGARETDLGLDVTVRSMGPLQVTGGVGLINTNVASGGGKFPSIETLFSEADTPGLEMQPTFLTWRAGARVDLRDVPANARAGGLYSVEVTEHIDRDLRQFSFRRYDLHAVQYFPFFDRRRAIVLRGRGMFADPRAGSQVPFFLIPTLGGPESLRGFREYRFRDTHMVLLTAEYRWEVFAALDMALFADGGMLAPRLAALALRDLKTSYGIGFRFSTRQKLLFRVDIGTGSEGTRLFARFIPVF